METDLLISMIQMTKIILIREVTVKLLPRVSFRMKDALIEVEMLA